MKALLFVGLWVVSTAVFSTELRFFEQRLTIHPDCTLEINRPDGSQEKKSFPVGNGYGECAIINLDGTNVPHLERMPRWTYVFLVEARKGLMEACRAEYWGVAVIYTSKTSEPDLPGEVSEVKILPKTRRSKTCDADRDWKEFEYFYGLSHSRKAR